MKSNVLTLTKAMFKNDETLSSMLGRTQKKKKSIFSSRLGMGLLLLFAAGSIGASTSIFMVELYKGLQPLGFESLLLRLIVPAAGFLVFMFGIFYVMNVFYFSRDIESYLYLPVRASDILSAKFLLTFLYELFVVGLLFLPMLVTYGIMDKAGPFYYFQMLLGLLLIPVLPLVAASLVAMFIMRFSKRFKNKDRFNMVAGMLSLFVALGLNFGIQFLSTRMAQGEGALIADLADLPILRIMGWTFPSSQFLTEALLATSATRSLLFMMGMILLTAFALFLFHQVGNLVYFKGVMGITESAANRRVLSRADLEKGTAQRSILLSYSIKELRLLLRTPVYFMNCVLVSLILPLFMVIPLLASGATSDFGEILLLLEDVDPGVFMGVLVGMGFFLASLNLIASTSFSREGRHFFFMKYIPVPYMTQVYAKILSAFYVQGMALVLVYALVLVFFPVDLAFILLSLPLVLMASLVLNQISITFDILWPKLHWDAEQQAVKQNLNGMFQMFLGFALAALVVFLSIRFQLSLFIVSMGSLVVFSLLILLLHGMLSRLVERKMAEHL